MDTVYINGIRAHTIIGVYEHERHLSQLLVIDLELKCDTRAAGLSDDFRQAIDYDAIARRTLTFVEASSYFLIEAVAENLANCLLNEFDLTQVRIRISKPGAVDIADDVGVTIERTKN